MSPLDAMLIEIAFIIVYSAIKYVLLHRITEKSYFKHPLITYYDCYLNFDIFFCNPIRSRSVYIYAGLLNDF